MSSAIVYGQNLTSQPVPRIAPTASSSHILIIGGGVIGLTTAWVLLDQGYKVTIIAKQWSTYSKDHRLTSQIAGALWEFPPAACGQHTDTISVEKSKKWCMVGYKVWESIAADPELAARAGVKMRRSVFFFTRKLENDRGQYRKMVEIEGSGVKGFSRNAEIVRSEGVDASQGVVDAYEHLAPVIDTDTAMKWLTDLVKVKGAEMITETIKGDLFAQEAALRARFSADAIINATGLASAELAGDASAYPIRGATLRVINDGTDFEKLSTALVMTADDPGNAANEMVFIVPRNENILLLGGIAQPHEWNLDLTLESPIIQRIRQRCEDFLPRLKTARLDLEYPLAQGLRPFRKGNVRLERESRGHRSHLGVVSRKSRIIHSYGHGGAGWTLSFGCAEDVAGLVEQVLRD